MSIHTRVVCGPDDPEMRAIERVASLAGVPIIAAFAGGRRVTPGTAYGFDAPLDVSEGDLLVECAPADGQLHGATRADHHRPGDPGYGLGPGDFMRASSLGQVIAALALRLALAIRERWDQTGQPHEGWDVGLSGEPTGWHQDHGRWAYAFAPSWLAVYPPAELVMVAAADHCLAAAYAGRCPGVEPDALLEWRLTAPGSPHMSEPDGKGGRRAVPPEIVRERAAEAKRLLLAAPIEPELSQPVKRGEDGGTEWTRFCPEVRDLRRLGVGVVGLPFNDVASRLGVAYVLEVREGGPDGPLKVNLGGCGEGSVPGIVSMAYWTAWARAQGYEGKVYGDAARGYAGAYKEKPCAQA